MYPPRVQMLIRDLREGGDLNVAYNHEHLPSLMWVAYGYNNTFPEYKGITSGQMSAGSHLGMNVIQIREFFLPFTVKKPWDQITPEEAARVLEDAMYTDRIRWLLVTPTHAKQKSVYRSETDQLSQPPATSSSQVLQASGPTQDTSVSLGVVSTRWHDSNGNQEEPT